MPVYRDCTYCRKIDAVVGIDIHTDRVYNGLYQN